MPFKKSAEELLEITGPIDITDVKKAIEWLKQNNVRPSKGRTLYFMQNNQKVLYSVNQIFKILNNNVKNNNIKLETDDVDSFQIYKIFNGFEYDDNFKLIAPWNDEGKKIINKYRNEILEYAVSLGYELNDLPIQYTAIKLNDRNFAEVHYPDKHSQVRIDIFYDRIPDNLKIKVHSERYDDDRRYSLNGKYELCLMEETVEEVKEYLRYCKENKEVILNYKSNQHKQDEIVQNPQNLNEGIKPPLNQILYGPPGTGKTYNTVIKAMEIIDNKKYENVSKELYADLKTEFNELRKQGRIEFVTFHQSYSYEEFVEGIKPDIESWETSAENLKYKGANGIFKKICNDADSKFTTKDFDNIYNKFLEEISNTDGIFKLTTKKYKKTFGLKVNNNDNLNIYMGEELIKQGSLTKENIKAHFLNARKRFDWANYYDSVVEYLETKYNLKKENVGTQPYILIIDEINRGNISKIFGELITLIEEDKRENLSVKLPYSQEEFTVPKNLYIIGTMNTSDRSIASIDIALRRRFKFKEMMPEIDLVADFKCNFQECFKTLNERISILLDRDHQIGHSYFIKEKHKDSGTEDLKEIWFDSIIPLLNEYFYGDWDKLQAILGEAKADESSFIKKQTINKTTFAKEIDICETESFDFNLKCDFNSAMKNAFGDNFTIGETNAQ